MNRYLNEAELRSIEGFMDDLSANNSFINNVRRKFDRYGSLSMAQVKVVQRIAREMRERAEREENALPVVEGRGVEITGKIIKVNLKFTQYGDQLKMRVLDDRGFEVWGTCPSKIDRDHDHPEGLRIKFVANVDRAPDNPKFGFFKRPRQITVLEAAEAVEA